MAAESRSTAVAVFQPPRLPWHPAIEERYGVDRGQWKALVEAVFPLAKSVDSVVLALSYCKARNLDVMKRVVHIVPIYDSNKREMVETVWPGIAEHRITAMRTKQHGGLDAPTFGPMITETFKGQDRKGNPLQANVTFPEWCQITVYRIVDGVRCPFPGPRIYWREFFSAQGRSGVPNERWARSPSQMLEKCAEAAALRRAFPEEIGDEHTAEEAEARGHMRDITPMPEAPQAAEPTRDQFTPRTTDASEARDIESADAPTVADASGEADDPTSHAPTSPEAPALDFGAPEQSLNVERASEDLLREVEKLKSARAIDTYLHTQEDVLTRIKDEYAEAHAYIMRRVGEAKKALAR